MTEPTGRTIDGTPWEEPRPPHLPDRLTALTPWVLPFVIVAIYQLWLLWAERPPGDDSTSHSRYWLDAIRFESAGIVASLLGAALFARHPDARSTLPRLAVGVFLVLLHHILRLLQPSLGPVFEQLTPAQDDLAFLSPLAQAYSVLAIIVGIAGVAAVASGLSAARRFADAVPGRLLVLGVAVISIISSSFYGLNSIASGLESSPSPMIWNAASWLLELFSTLAWGYLVAVAIGGWLGREGPTLGWALAAAGASVAWLYQVVTSMIVVTPSSAESLVSVVQAISLGYLAGWLLLLAAFVVGLPATRSETDATTDPREATLPGSATG